jgi:trans-aconitate methyltransferase
MEDPDQARAYSEGDFADAHEAIVDDLTARHHDLGDGTGLDVVDLGCGPADVTVRLARRLPRARLVGVDAGPVMLALGRERVRRSAVDDRVTLVEGAVPDLDPAMTRRFHLVTSNSLLHHLPDPSTLWAAVRYAGAPGAAIHVADLCRPPDTTSLETLVARHAEGAPAVLAHDFRASLAAAYRPDEVAGQLERAGLHELSVEVISDRHLVVWGRLRG